MLDEWAGKSWQTVSVPPEIPHQLPPRAFPTRRAPDRHRARSLIVIALCCLMLLGFQAWREWAAYSEQMRETKASLTNLASALAQHAEDTVEIADTAVLSLVGRIETIGVLPGRLGEVEAELAAQVTNGTRYSAITVFNADGALLASSYPISKINVADRAYFRHHRDNPGRGSFVGPPIRSRISGQWAITVSRRFQSSDGGFAGVVVANIPLQYFVDHYAKYKLGSRSSIILVTPDAMLLARYPSREILMGQSIASAAVFAELRKSPSGSYRSTAIIDGITRLSGYQQSSRYPLVVMTSMAEDEALGAWRSEMRLHLLMAVVVDGILALLGLHLIRQTRASQAAQARLRESEREHRQQAEHHQLGEQRHRMLIDGVAEYAIYWLDTEGCVRSWGAGAFNLTGYDEAEITGRHMSVFYTSEDVAADKPQDALREAAQAGRFTSDGWRVRKDGSQFWASVLIKPIYSADGDLIGFAKIIQDNTEQRRKAAELRDWENRERALVEATNADLERLSRHLIKARDKADSASRAKSRFLAGMSHELRTPLNGILGYAQLLQMEGDLDAKQSERVHAMLTAGKHLLQMITCVLNLSEIEAEHMELTAVAFDVREVVAACLDLIRPSAEAKGLVLSITTAPDTPQDLIADPTRVRQVLLNLLGNAAKFTAQGTIEVRLSRLTDRSMFRVEIVDTGAGIPMSQRQRLFQEFGRLDTDITRETEGAGLGLALAQRLTTLMGGRLGHDDNPDGGSIFWLELPLNTEVTAGHAPIPAFKGQTMPTASGAAQRWRVLVVDDILMNRDIAASFLRAAGHEAMCAEEGAQAVAMATNIDFDVILMDVQMPQMGGLEATRHIRALMGPRGQVPIVALTAHAFGEQVEECKAAGMNRHLSKPFDIGGLLAVVTAAVDVGRSDGKPQDAAGSSTGLLECPAPSSVDTELPISDHASFDRTARLLHVETVSHYMQTMSEMGETVLSALCEPAVLTSENTLLIDAAHALTGTAGMFGFERLTATGRRFEGALQSDSAQVAARTAEFRAAVEATLLDIKSR